MRLKLNIQRQNKPTLHILWNTEGLRPNAEPGGPDASVADLLGQVNEVIALETEHRGLEDYAVEVNGFECLHWVSLSQILKDEDEVTQVFAPSIAPVLANSLHSIRFLRTHDRRARTISGRIRASEDGRQLLDGVAFTRRLIKPPRTPDEEGLDEDTEEDGSYEDDTTPRKRQRRHESTATPTDLVLQSIPLTDDLDSDTSSQSEEPELSDIDQEALAEELQALAEEEQPSNSRRPGSSSLRIKKRKRGHGLGIQEGTEPDVFPDVATDRTTYRQDGTPGRVRRSAEGTDGRRTRRSTRTASDRKLAKAMTEALTSTSRRSSRSSPKSVHFQDEDDFETPATLRELDLQDDSDSSDDEDFAPREASGSLESNKENVEPQFNDLEDLPSTSDGDGFGTSDSSEDSDEDSDSDSDEFMSDEDSSSENANDDDTDTDDSDSDSDSESSSDTSSSDSSGSSSDSESDEDENAVIPEQIPFVPNSGVADISTSEQPAQATLHRTPPGQGKSQTKNRNRRRKLSKRLKQLKAEGLLHQDATLNDLMQYEDITDPGVTRDSPADDLETRRKELLAAIEAGGVDLSPQQPEPRLSTAGTGAPQAQPIDQTTHVTVSEDVIMSDSAQQDDQEGQDTTGTRASEATAESTEAARPRTKLDLAGSRRMLFGSLGLRAPKSKSDEEDLRTKLLKDIKPVPINPRLEELEATNHDQSVENDESWKDKIVLKAVECCYESEELSTPPFPFVQRWDKSQRGPYGNKSGSKKRKRKEQVYAYEEDEENAEAWEEEEVEALVEESQPMEGSQSSPQGDDLPPLPDDLSTLPPLQLSTALVGDVITFKHLEMSAATNWQPVSSGYRTATIDNIDDRGNMELTLALRDRSGSDTILDESTGERLYSKFEMPGMEEVDDGFLELAFAAMEDPRLVQKSASIPDQAEASASNEGRESLAQNDQVSVHAEELISHSGRNLLSTGDKNTIEAVAAPTSQVTMLDQELADDAGASAVGRSNTQQSDDAATDRTPQNLLQAMDTTPPDQPVRIPAENTISLANQIEQGRDSTMTPDTPKTSRSVKGVRSIHDISPNAQRDISALIRDAGFHSDIASDIRDHSEQALDSVDARSDILSDLNAHLDRAAQQLDDEDDTYSEFNGFTSSPPDTTMKGTEGNASGRSSPPLEDDHVQQTVPDVCDESGVYAEDRLRNSSLNTKEAGSSQVVEQPDTAASNSPFPVFDGSEDLTMEVPAHKPEKPSPSRKQQRSNSAEKSDVHDSAVTIQYSQDQTNDLPANSTSLEPSYTHAQTLVSLASKHTHDVNEPSSDDLPSIDDLIQSQSTLRSQAARYAASQSTMHGSTRPSFEADSPVPASTAPATTTRVGKAGTGNRQESRSLSVSSVGSSNNDTENDSRLDEPPLPSLSKSRKNLEKASSQMVDLTMTSDGVEAESSEYEEESSSLPSGPGWVKKLRGSFKEATDKGDGGDAAPGRMTRSRSNV